MSRLDCQIDLKWYFDKFLGRCATHLLDMEGAIRAAEERSETTDGISFPGPHGVTWTFRSYEPEFSPSRRLAETAFKNLIAEFGRLLDEQIAIKRLCSIPLEIRFDGERTQAGLIRGLQKRVDEETAKVRADASLRSNVKTAQFPLGESASATINGYFQLRNCLEHHSGFPKHDISFRTRDLALFVGDRQYAIPALIPVDGEIAIKSVEKVFTFPAGERVALLPEQVHAAFTTLHSFVVPAMQRWADESEPVTLES